MYLYNNFTRGDIKTCSQKPWICYNSVRFNPHFFLSFWRSFAGESQLLRYKHEFVLCVFVVFVFYCTYQRHWSASHWLLLSPHHNSYEASIPLCDFQYIWWQSSLSSSSAPGFSWGRILGDGRTGSGPPSSGWPPLILALSDHWSGRLLKPWKWKYTMFILLDTSETTSKEGIWFQSGWYGYLTSFPFSAYNSSRWLEPEVPQSLDALPM